MYGPLVCNEYSKYSEYSKKLFSNLQVRELLMQVLVQVLMQVLEQVLMQVLVQVLVQELLMQVPQQELPLQVR